MVPTGNQLMKVTTKRSAATSSGRALVRAFDNLFAEIERIDAEDRAREAVRRVEEAETRTRRAIERQCRKRYFRQKYEAMGLWPLPPVGTTLNA